MPPKFDPNSPESAALIKSFSELGLTDSTAKEVARKPKDAAALKALIEENKLAGKTFSATQAAALVKLSATGSKLTPEARAYIVERIAGGDLNSPDQVAGVLACKAKLTLQPQSSTSRLPLPSLSTVPRLTSRRVSVRTLPPPSQLTPQVSTLRLPRSPPS